MTNYKYLIMIFAFTLFSCKTFETAIYKDLIKEPSNWVIEQQPGGKVLFENNGMEVIDVKGCTVWMKHKLQGNVKIAYDVTVIDNGGPQDRVSDLNCFWMANDPKNPEDFFKESKSRAGHFPNYHHLKLYYVGYGGHHNTKTRFRRYNGNINRPLLTEHDLSDKKFMITANKKMHIEIVVKDNYTTYSRDGEMIYEINDPDLYTSGYFGFRTVNNHMLIENFEVSRL